MPKVHPDELRARVAQRIRDAAKKKGISLTKLADAAGISQASIWVVLKGSSAASLDTIAKLAMALDVDPDELTRRYRKPK